MTTTILVFIRESLIFIWGGILIGFGLAVGVTLFCKLATLSVSPL